jgi:hypothetical protein
MKMILEICICLALALVMALSIAAQAPNGILKGLVTDPNGAVIPGAEIKIRRLTEPIDNRSKINTDYEGEFTIANLPFGTYELTIETPGFNRAFTRRVEITPVQPTRINIVFSFAACSDEPETLKGTEITRTDHAEIVNELIRLFFGTVTQRKDEKKVIFSPDNFNIDWLTSEQRSRISIMTRDKIQELTEKTDSQIYYTITKPAQRGRCVAISLLNNLTIKGQFEDANMAGGEDNYEFRKVNGKWVGLLLSSMIS